MKKLLTITLLVLLTSLVSQAQSKLSYELTAGVLHPGFSDLPFDYESNIGAQASFRAWYNLKPSLQIGVETHYMNLAHSGGEGAKLNAHYLGLPVLLKASFPSKLYVITGLGYAGWVAFTDTPLRTQVAGVAIPAPASDITGFVYLPSSLGYKVSDQLSIEARMILGLSNFSKTYEYKATPYALSLAYSF